MTDNPTGQDGGLKTVPREPTIEMLVAGRKQTFADMTGEHMGPSAENTWKAMFDAAMSQASTPPQDEVERAYREGYAKGMCAGSLVCIDEDWQASRAALTAMKGTDNA